MATRYTSLGTAALIAGSIGASVYTASTAQQAREAITAAHDPTTAHGDLIMRVDAGGADVTALARLSTSGAPDGGVLTVAGGVPQWAAAGGAQAATWTSVTATSFSRRDGTRGTVALSGSRLDFTLDGVAAAYYDGTARTAPRAYYAPPASAAEVALIYRLYTRSSGAAQTYTALVGLLRSGADDTAAPSASSSYFVSPAAVTLPGVARYNDGTRIYYGDYNGAGAFGAAGTGGVAWPANDVVDDTWLGVRWIAGQVFYGVVVAPSTSPPTVADLQWYTGGAAARWAGPPSLAVLALEQTGGSPSAQAITAECVLYYR